jgi:hypothetical protein
MAQMTLFISHISDEAELAIVFQRHILDDFLGLVDVFVSSDTESIQAGSNWLESMKSAMERAQGELILCSEASVKRPWINFEAGAGWMKGIPIVPVCHSGYGVTDLSMPLSVLQAINANQKKGLDRLYTLIADELGVRKPIVDFSKFIEEVKTFENTYSDFLDRQAQSQKDKENDTLKKIRELLLKQGQSNWRDVNLVVKNGGLTRVEALTMLRKEPSIAFEIDQRGERVVKLSRI